MLQSASRLLLAALASFVLATPALAATPGDAQGANAALEAAYTSTDRPKADAEQDERRQSHTVLGLLNVKPGMHVIDVFSAGGYNTELLARAVGVKGEVIAYNNPAYAKYSEKGITERYANDRLGNVKQVTAEPTDLKLDASSLDAALIVMSYHDAYWRPKDGSFDHTDPDVLVKKLYAALKPGGVVVVQDHVAVAGTPPKAAAELHRIDPATVKRDFEKAGFKFDTSSDVLKHPADDHTKVVFDPSVKGKTDQFVYRFRKP